MAIIKKVSGSEPYDSPLVMLLKANEEYLFEAINWSSKVTNTTDAIIWRLKDASQKNTLKVIEQKALKEQSIKITIHKKYAGYAYFLEAELVNTGEKAVAYICGFCNKRIISSAWSKKKEGLSIKNKKDLNPIAFGDLVFLHLEIEGLNGTKVIVEIYNQEKGADNKVAIYTSVAVTNGEVNLKIIDTYVWRSKINYSVDSVEQFYIKVKDNKGNYVIDNLGDDLHAIYLNIENKITSKDTNVPNNLTPTKIREADFEMLSLGVIELVKAEVLETNLVVCNDYYLGDNDVWLLEHDGNMKYHWLKDSLRKLNTDNNKKPEIIPVIIDNSKKFEIKLTFNTIISSADNIKIRVRDKSSNYRFPLSKPYIKKLKGEEFSLEFKSKNRPFLDTVECLEDFKLIVEYSFDESVWLSLGEVPFSLYIPWNDATIISYDSLDPSVKFDFDGKKAIRETLIWLGCKYAKGLGNNISLTPDENEEVILDAVFEPFKTKTIFRRRENRRRPDGITYYLANNFPEKGMGYWRGESLPETATGSFEEARKKQESFSFLLSHGEARCGEWTDFFKAILLMLGIDVVAIGSISICTAYAMRLAPKYFPPHIFKYRSTGFKFTEETKVFAVKNAIHSDLSDFTITSGNSPGQGTKNPRPYFSDHIWLYYQKKGRFFDASYGISYSGSESNLTQYCSENIGSVYTEVLDTTRSPARLSGINKIHTTNLHDFIISSKNLFK